MLKQNTAPLFRNFIYIAVITAITYSSVCGTCSAETGFKPGAVLREFRWYGPWVNASKWQRVTHPGATHSGAKEFLPNPVNRVTIDDLEYAVGAEVCIELLQSHAGTHNKRIRLNGNEWLRIPEADEITGSNPECYQTLTYPVVELPLSQINEGVNTFKLTTDGQICHNFGWGQFIIYGVTFRIFYDDSKNHPDGSITSPLSDTTIGENPVITAEASSPDGIKQIDFIGFYEDFNYKSDNIWRQWQYTLSHGLLSRHLGTAKEKPYSITWNTGWVPDQKEPMMIMARITDNNGMQYITPAVENIQFTRENRLVKMYKPYNVPTRWATRTGNTHSCRVTVPHDLSNAVDARMILVSWAGTYADSIGINKRKVVSWIGKSYDRSYDEIPVPLGLILPGENSLFTYARTDGHGIEVNWPGIVLKIAFEGAAGVDENGMQDGLDTKSGGFGLFQNTPNPFNPSTIIDYQLPHETHVILTIYNIHGQQVTVVKKGREAKGRHSASFDASGLSCGLYFYRLETGEFVQTKKMLLIK